MPTYDYVCQNCENSFEEFQSITANPLKKCPKCGKNKLKRLIGSGAGIIFKGTGFYQTDYRSDNYKKSADSSTSSSSTAASDTSNTTKAEPAKTAEPTPAPAAEKKAEPKKTAKKSA